MDIKPLVKKISQADTVRLVASARARASVLSELVIKEHVDDLAEIKSATSGRLRAQEGGTGKLDPRELVYDVPHATFINAAFVYARPRALNRFNGPERGAWYAAFHVDTALAEVAYHMARELGDVGDYNAAVDYTEMFASFIGDFVDLRGVTPAPECLDADPAIGYPAGNAVAVAALAARLSGVVYPSVRHVGGTCLAALIPHAVQSVRQGALWQLKWSGSRVPAVTQLST